MQEISAQAATTSFASLASHERLLLVLAARHVIAVNKAMTSPQSLE